MVGICSAGLALLQSETSDTIPVLEDVLSKHASVFCEGLGKMKNIQAWIQLKQDVQPWLWRACPIAFAYKPAVNEALRGLEAEGVIKKVATRKWAAPIVTPVKKDGGVRVCGDFKVTIIPPFGNQWVPSSLHWWCTLFSDLDMCHAY